MSIQLYTFKTPDLFDIVMLKINTKYLGYF